jgi:hypothetical protein
VLAQPPCTGPSLRGFLAANGGHLQLIKRPLRDARAVIALRCHTPPEISYTRSTRMVAEPGRRAPSGGDKDLCFDYHLQTALDRRGGTLKCVLCFHDREPVSDQLPCKPGVVFQIEPGAGEMGMPIMCGPRCY